MTPSDKRAVLGAWFYRAWSSTLIQNVVTNYAAVVWTTALSLVTIPVALRILGHNEWGIVAACVTLRGLLTLLDAGFSQIMPRDIAQVAGDIQAEARLFSAFSKIYWALGFCGFGLAQIGARYISAQWLNAPGADMHELEVAVRIIAIQFLFQFANGANVAFWNGIQRQKRANIRQCVFATARQFSAIGSLVFFGGHAIAYLLPSAAIASIECLTNRSAIRRDLGCARSNAHWKDVLRVAREGGGLTIAVIVGIAVSQLDKVVLSKTLTLADYGAYVIVANLGIAFMQLQYPLMRAFFPIVARNEVEGRTTGSGRLTAAVFALCIAPCAVAAIFAHLGLRLWLHDERVAAIGTTPLRLILLAVCINALYNVIYQRMVAAGKSNVIVAANVGALCVSIVSWYVFGRKAGLIGGGVIWVASSTAQLVVGYIWHRVNRRDLRDQLATKGVNSFIV